MRAESQALLGTMQTGAGPKHVAEGTDSTADWNNCREGFSISFRIPCRESDPEKLRALCRKALRDCQEQKAAAWDLETKAMRLERDKEALGAPSSVHRPATIAGRLDIDAADAACWVVPGTCWPQACGTQTRVQTLMRSSHGAGAGMDGNAMRAFRDRAQPAHAVPH